MNKVELRGKLARDCHAAETKKGGTMCFLTVQATRDGGTDFLPVKAFNVSDTMTALLVKGAEVLVMGRLQAGKYDKEKKVQLYENIVVAEEILCGGNTWAASAMPVPTAPAQTQAAS
jgi:single-stranded DNA-binding protein